MSGAATKLGHARLVIASAGGRGRLGSFSWGKSFPAEPADLIFADPPYASGELPRLLDWLSAHAAECLTRNGRVVIETDLRNVGDFEVGAQRAC